MMKLAIIVTEYPKTTEVFILRDVLTFIQLGAEVRFYHLAARNKTEILHDFARPIDKIASHPDLLGGKAIAAARRHRRDVASATRDIVRRQWPEPVLMTKSIAVIVSACAIAEDLQRWGADHVHAEFAGHPATAAWMINRITGIPYSVSCRAHDIFRTQRLLREKLGAAAFVRTISDFGKDFLLRNVPGLTPERINVIHSSVDVGIIPKLCPKIGGTFHILFVGSLQKRKGVDILLRALARLGFNDWRCTIAGDGPDRRMLEALAQELGFDDGRVTFIGRQDFNAVTKLYGDADVVAVPSIIGPKGRTEGIPNVAIEGLAFQRPVISTALSGIPELIQNGVTGQLVAPGEVQELVDAITFVRNDPDAAHRMARAGRRHVEQQFSLSVNARRQFDLFRRYSRLSLVEVAE